MNNTQLLSVTENLCISRIKDTLKMKQEQVTWYSNDGTLVFWKWKTAVTTVFSPAILNRKISACFILGDSFTIHTLQLHKYIKDS